MTNTHGPYQQLCCKLLKTLLVQRMKEKDKIIAEIQTSQAKQNKEDNNKVYYITLYEEFRCFQSYVSLSDAFTGSLLGVAPSAWDILTDLRFANELRSQEGWKRAVAMRSYAFICLPGVVLFVRKLQALATFLVDNSCL